MRLWKSVLGVQRVGVETDFFEVGGHSLAAVKMLHHIEVEYGRSIGAHLFARRPTIRWLAQQIGAAAHETGMVDRVESLQ